MLISGLDAVTYLQFLRLLRWLFLTISLFAALPLTLANYYMNTRTEYGSLNTQNSTDLSGATTGPSSNSTTSNSTSLLDNMQILTAANITGEGLWVQIGFEWIVTCFVLLYGEYKAGGRRRGTFEMWRKSGKCAYFSRGAYVVSRKARHQVGRAVSVLWIFNPAVAAC